MISVDAKNQKIDKVQSIHDKKKKKKENRDSILLSCQYSPK